MDCPQLITFDPAGIRWFRSADVGAPAKSGTLLVFHQGRGRFVGVPHDGDGVPRDVLQVGPGGDLHAHYR